MKRLKRPHLARKSSARMDEQTNLITKDHGAALDGLAPRTPFITLEMAPRESHLLDYLMILRKHQWLIVSFLLALVTIVTIATFRIQPIYEATTRIEIDRENTNFLPFAGNDPYDLYQDLEDYIETQSKILVSETLGMQTVKSLNLDQDPRFGGQPLKPGNSARRGAERRTGIASPRPGSVSGSIVGQTRAEQPVAGRYVCDHGPEAGGAYCQYACKQFHRAEFPQPLRSHNSGVQLAGEPAG